jgi:hypothetical protein
VKRAFAPLRIAALLLLVAAPTQAKRFRAELCTADVQILDNGDLRVTERSRFRFVGGPFTQTYRTLSRRNADGITVESSPESLEVSAGRSVRVIWRFPACADTVRDFTLVYRVAGALRRDGERRVLDWRAFPDQRRYAIRSATARVSWPASWPEPLRAAAGPGKVRSEREPHAVDFDAGFLDRQRTLRVQLEFPAVGIAAPMPAWQARHVAQRQKTVLGGGLAVAVLGFGIALVLVLYRELAPPRPATPRRLRQTTPPSDMPAALAGVLAAGDANFQHLIACVAELAAGDHLAFETALSKRWWGGGEYVIRRGKPIAARAPWEQAVLDALARYEESGTTSWTRALTALRGSVLAFRTATRAELQRRGDFDAQAGERPRVLRNLAVIAGVLAIAGFAVATLEWKNWGPGTLFPGIAFVVVTIVALVAAAALPRYTPAGLQRAMAWRGFAASLKELAKRPQPIDSQQFQAWLPYALALGVAAQWIQAGKKWKLEVPAWFRVPGADSMTVFAAVFAAASAVPTGASVGSGGAGGGASGAR